MASSETHCQKISSATASGGCVHRRLMCDSIRLSANGHSFNTNNERIDLEYIANNVHMFCLDVPSKVESEKCRCECPAIYIGS
eukprot:scaffold404874_cov18-Prasinocladus_malaysianus.AAC.2